MEFTCTYGDISEGFYSSMVKMFDQLAILSDRDEELYKEFSERLDSVVSDAPEGSRCFTRILLHNRVGS